MMSHRLNCSGVALILILAAVMASATAYAEDSLLWKSSNPAFAVVVPAYGGQPSPFPSAAPVQVDVSATSEVDEKRRLRDAAFDSAERQVNSGNALQADLRTLNVGGVVEGTLGRRVLVNNQWIGVGTQLGVRQYKSPVALEAIKALAEYDAGAADELTRHLNSQLTAQPILKLTLERITSGSLVLGSTKGKYDIKFNINSM